MLIFLLLRRLSPKRRRLIGLALLGAGLALVAVSAAVAPGLLVHGVLLAVVGAVLAGSAMVSGRRARLAARPAAAQGAAAERADGPGAAAGMAPEDADEQLAR